jgi:hypothetical protein
MTNSVRSYEGFQNGNFGVFRQVDLLSTKTLRIFFKVVNHEGHSRCDFLHPLLNLRCTRLLAHLGHVFFRPAILDYEEANTVSSNKANTSCVLSSDILSSAQTHDQVQIRSF